MTRAIWKIGVKKGVPIPMPNQHKAQQNTAREIGGKIGRVFSSQAFCNTNKQKIKNVGMTRINV